ncbi:MAG: hypothetical protein IPK82_23875 [Polyangiaceae bacterium]|nr:hypothetical protein [Polyangiaceae bacterium]
MPFVEVATSIRGLVQFLVALAKANLVDCQSDTAVRDELHRRWETRASIVYTRDGRRSTHGTTRGTDRWTCFSLLRERAHDKPIEADCEDLAALWAAHLLLRGFRVALSITQPREGAMAHAYVRVFDGQQGAWRVWDPSVWHGMKDPGPDFYTTGETFSCELEQPC